MTPVSAFDKLRSYAESRASDDEVLELAAFTYGQLRELYSAVRRYQRLQAIARDEGIGREIMTDLLLRLLDEGR